MLPWSDGSSSPELEGPVRHSEIRAVAALMEGKPQLIERYHTAPLKIAKTFPLTDARGPSLAVVQMDVSPGMLDGDHYTYDWQLEEQVRLYATNQAYTRVHPCLYSNTQVIQRFKLAPGAALEWMPEPVMLYKDAKYDSSTEVELSKGAICMLADTMCPGRMARGERFAFSRWDTRLAVKYEGELIHYQRQRLAPHEMDIAGAGSFGEYSQLATVSAFGDGIDRKLADAVMEKLEQLIPPGIACRWSVASTARKGIVVMAAGHRTWELQRLQLLAWDTLRSLLWGAEPFRLLKEAWMDEVWA